MISFKIPEAMIELIDDLVKMNLYPSRSAFVRTAIRDLLKREHPKFGGKPMLVDSFKTSGCVTQGRKAKEKPKKVEENILYVDPKKYLKEEDRINI